MVGFKCFFKRILTIDLQKTTKSNTLKIVFYINWFSMCLYDIGKKHSTFYYSFGESINCISLAIQTCNKNTNLKFFGYLFM